MTSSLERFFEALIKTMTDGAELAQTAEEDFAQDLASETGFANRQPFDNLTGFVRFRALSLSYLSARSAVTSCAKSRKAILRLRSLPLSERLLIAQALSWHQRYTLRERLRKLLDGFRTAKEIGSLDESISQVAGAYKRKTDRLLRHRHLAVHEFDHHEPLIRQVEIFELLAHAPEPDFKRAMSELGAVANRRAKKLVHDRLSDEERRFIEVTDTAFEQVFELRTVWTFETR